MENNDKHSESPNTEQLNDQNSEFENNENSQLETDKVTNHSIDNSLETVNIEGSKMNDIYLNPSENIDKKLSELDQYNYDEQVYAGFWMRFWAYIIDLLVIVSIRVFLVKPVGYLFNLNMDGGLFTPYNILSAIIFYAYFVLMTKYLGQTLGKMIFGLKVISQKEEKLSWKTVLFREWIGRYISVTVKLLYILVAFLPKKQALHDVFADTVVIHENVVKKPDPVYS